MSKGDDFLAKERARLDALMKEEDEKGDLFWRYRYTLRVGDKITVRADDPWFRGSQSEGKRYPAGSEGEIVGFAVQSVCRFSSRRRKPGIYVDQEWPYVRLAGAVDVRRIRANYLQLADEEAVARIEQQRRDVPERSNLHGAFIRDLPDTDVWEGDIVRPKFWLLKDMSKKVSRNSVPGLKDAFVINWMNYVPHPGDIYETLDVPPRFSIADRFFRESAGGFYATDLDLLERGNLWRRDHGEPVSFRDLAEEAFFLCHLGEIDKTGSLSFSTKEEAVAAVRTGPWHGVRYYDEFTGWGSSTGYEVVRYLDQEAGKRIAEATLATGFLIPGECDPPA